MIQLLQYLIVFGALQCFQNLGYRPCLIQLFQRYVGVTLYHAPKLLLFRGTIAVVEGSTEGSLDNGDAGS